MQETAIGRQGFWARIGSLVRRVFTGSAGSPADGGAGTSSPFAKDEMDPSGPRQWPWTEKAGGTPVRGVMDAVVAVQRAIYGAHPKVDLPAIMASLAPHAKRDSGEMIDLSQPYQSGYEGGLPDPLGEAWKLKDAGALGPWKDPAMLSAFTTATTWNTSPEGDYLGRALQSNMDSSLWYQLLEARHVIPCLAPEWRKAIELATLLLDVGTDPLGRTGFKEILEAASSFPPDVVAKVALLVGGSGRGGAKLEQIYADPSYASKFAADLAAQARPKDAKGPLEAALKELESLPKGWTAADRDAFASAQLVVKLADQSRGKAYRAVRGASALGEQELQKLESEWVYKDLPKIFSEARAKVSAAKKGGIIIRDSEESRKIEQ